jgi:hypothetical protein
VQRFLRAALYDLDRLAARPAAAVLVVEGERTADGATMRFKDYVVVRRPVVLL